MSELVGGEHISADDRIDRREALRIWLRLLASSNTIEREINARLRERFGNSLARFDFLAQLERAEEGELTMTELSLKLMVSGGNITGLTDRLAKEGLVERRAHPGDRRVQRIALTEAGKALFTEMANEHASWVAEIMSGLDVALGDSLMKALEAIKVPADRAANSRISKEGFSKQ